jgi:hypothetical protein
MIENPSTLMFAGAAIGGTVAYLLFHGRIAAMRMRNADLAARASATGQRVSEQAATIAHQQETITRLISNAKGAGIIWRKLQTAQEVLHAAAAQNTSAAARKVISEGLERVRCAGETEIDGGAE